MHLGCDGLLQRAGLFCQLRQLATQFGKGIAVRRDSCRPAQQYQQQNDNRSQSGNQHDDGDIANSGHGLKSCSIVTATADGR